jgi:cytochrome c-type biogenesis protein CcmH
VSAASKAERPTASTSPASGAAPSGSAGGRRAAWIALCAGLVVAAVALVIVAVRGPSAPPTFEQRVDAIASELRCPVCQNLSVSDSPSELAQQMRAEIARRLRLGQSEAEIDAFFTAKYGQWILLTPDAGGIGLFAWLTPALAIAAGAGIAWTVVRRRRRPSGADVDSAPLDEADLDERLLLAADVADGADHEPRLTDEERAQVQRELDAIEENA